MLKKNPRDSRFEDPEELLAEEYSVLPVSRHEVAPPAPDVAPLREGGPVSRQQPETAPQGSTAAPAALAETIIGPQSSFEGRFESAHDVRVLGSVSGELVCAGKVTIEREATARARIEARDVHILGRLEGDAICSGQLVLAPSAVVTGTMKAATLVVEAGATIKGTVESVRPVESAPQPRELPELARGGATDLSSLPPRPVRVREVPSFALVTAGERPDGILR